MMSRIPALRRVKQEDHKFKASLVYIVRFVSGKKKKEFSINSSQCKVMKECPSKFLNLN
jgi:hypothetical protein